MLALADELERGARARHSNLELSEIASPRRLKALAAKWFLERGLREASFGSDIVGEPAWDMLLFLYANAGEEDRMLKTSVTNASGVPHSTALRYLTMLEQKGLVEINRSLSDSRVQLVALTPSGFSKMSACLMQAIGRDNAAAQNMPGSTNAMNQSRSGCSPSR